MLRWMLFFFFLFVYICAPFSLYLSYKFLGVASPGQRACQFLRLFKDLIGKMPTRKDEPIHTHTSKSVLLPSLYLTHLSVKSCGNSMGKQSHIVVGLVCWAISIHCLYIYETILLSSYCYGHNGNIHSLGVWLLFWLRLIRYWDLYAVAIQGLALPRGECQVFGILGSLEGFLGSPLHILCHERYDSLSLSLSVSSVSNTGMASPIRQTCWVSHC